MAARAAAAAAARRRSSRAKSRTTISGEAGAPPRLAVPDFIALSTDAETVAIAKTIGQVLWDDLNFEREFAFIPRDVYAHDPGGDVVRRRAVRSLARAERRRRRRRHGAEDRRRRSASRCGCSTSRTRQSVFGEGIRRIGGQPAALRAHDRRRDSPDAARAARRRADEADVRFRPRRRAHGAARSRTASVKEIYIADYDGENQRRVTVGKTLNIIAAWSPDGRSIAYTSYRRGTPNIFISNIYQGTLEEVTKGDGARTGCRRGRPTARGSRSASTRDGNPEIYVVNRDGSNLRRLTNHPGIDITPTWSPSGTQIAFTSDRTGTPQIYVVGADGLGPAQRITTSESYCGSADVVAGAVQRDRVRVAHRPGLRHQGASTWRRGRCKQLTFGEGTNESPAFAPNGRHLAFTSTRSGKAQIFTMARDGKNVRQITKAGNN